MTSQALQTPRIVTVSCANAQSLFVKLASAHASLKWSVRRVIQTTIKIDFVSNECSGCAQNIFRISKVKFKVLRDRFW
jgi:hypothetical protein